MKEFTERGFDQASTNQIVKYAGIGKGMLFYYFNSKKELYFYLINYCIEMTEQYLELIDADERDLFQRMKRMAIVKLDFLKKHPNAMDFLGDVYLNNFDQMDEVLKSKIEELQKISYSRLYGDIDYSLFREDIDAEKAFDLIRWSFDGYEKEMVYRLRGQKISSIDYDPYWEEFYEYLDILKTSFYKKEEDEK